MRAAHSFADHLVATGRLPGVRRISCSLYGSLGATGLGHGTPDAILAGLAGLRPETCDPSDVRAAWSGLAEGATLKLAGTHHIPISKDDVSFEPRTRLPGHPNALTLSAWGQTDALPLFEETYYSIGGGFIRREGDRIETRSAVPHPMAYASSEELLALCDTNNLGIYDIARANEEAIHGSEKLDAGLDAIWDAMHDCVEAGLHVNSTLPGGRGVKRRASAVRLQSADTILGEKAYPDLASLPEVPDIVDVFRRASDVPGVIDDALASGAPTVWVQLGIWNQEAAEHGESKGLTVVMDRCIKVEHARFNGGPHLLGFNTGQITTRKTIR